MRRHDLLLVDPLAWQAVLEEHQRLTALPLVAGWAEEQWPVIVRRRTEGDAASVIPAALPLPPCYGKHRVGFSLRSKQGVTAYPPVLLRDAARAAPPEWQTMIAALVALGGQVGVAPRVFGALLWQHITGLPYLTERSDVDLLWAVSDHATAATLLAGLQRRDAQGPVRLDGELELPGGGGVSWREMALAAERGCDEVLVKTMHGVTACHVAGLFAMAPAQ